MNEMHAAGEGGEMLVRGASRLVLRNLSIHFAMPSGIVRAVNDVSISIAQGETVGVVGESGSGKSVTFLSVMGIVRAPGRIVAGSIELDGRSLATLPAEGLRE
ncbi:MAG: ATP-binding cassette domain-containing protein, partial [Alphaproteobacteria bacterium]|nr:ATP-binding cassette domain-containing protein [Alphaproteobacteria bacterium]